MRRWGVLGLLVVAACSGTGGVSEQNHEECGDVSTHSVPASAPAQLTDGREPVLVRYRPGVRVSAAAVQRAGGQVTAQFHSVPAVAARVTPEEKARLAADPSVELIEPDLELHAFGRPRTSGSPDEYTDAVRQVQAPQVWDANEDGVLDPGAPTGAGIRVCIIDTGLDRRHPELTLPYAGGYDFVDNDDDPSDETDGLRGLGHGTHVAGIVAAQLGSAGTTCPGMSAGGIVGVAPGVELLIARVLNVKESASVSNVLKALEWCQAQHANIASLSLGAPMSMGKTAQDAFQAASDAGMLLIAASGNDADETFLAPISYPAAYPSVLAVGAVDSRGEVASFSNGGEALSLVGPGVNVLSAVTVQGATTPELDVEGTRVESRSIFFAPAGEVTGELVDCDVGEPQGCKSGTCDGFVAYVRMTPGYSTSRILENVMKQGARAVILGVPESETQSWQYGLEGPGRTWVPAVTVGKESRDSVLKQVGKQARLSLRGVDYAWMEGTSMATPHVTGAAALVWSARPSLTAAQVRTLLESTAKDLDEPGHDMRTGFGLVQVKAALEALQRMP